MTNNDGELLSQLFIERIKRTLTDAALDAIRPAVKEAVDAVVREMAPQVEAYVDHLKHEYVVRLVTKEIPAK